MWPTIHTKTGLGKNPNIVSDCTSTFGYARIQTTLLPTQLQTTFLFPTPLPISSLRDATAVEKVTKGAWGLPSYVTEALKDLLWVLAIRATHMPCFL